MNLAEGETQIRIAPVVPEVKLVLDQHRTDIGVISHTVATYPWVDQRQRQ
jgi:hypothetical protein